MNKIIVLIVGLFLFGIVSIVFLVIPKKGSETVVTAPVTTEPRVPVVLDKSNVIVLNEPLLNATATSPLIISGKARGMWFFEASFPVKLFDLNGVLLGTAIAQAQGDWMTQDFVPFIASLQFTSPTTTNKGILVLEKDNPSGLVEHDDALEVPVFFETNKSATRSVQVYYYNSSKDMDEHGNILCSVKGLVSVERAIPFTSTPVQDTIRLLLKGGLTERERMSGLSTEYPLLGVELKGAALANDILTLNISDPNNRTVGGSCRVAILRSQIEATARQFSGITSVEFINQGLFQP